MQYLHEPIARRDIPEGKFLVHNVQALRVDRRLFDGGFRAFLVDDVSERSNYIPCTCGWRSDLGPHYIAARSNQSIAP
jgi:hypothetical protein